MKHRTFFWFILPTLSAMILFIALPIVSVFIQSLFVQHEQVLVVSESCGPFGCKESTSVDLEATQKLRDEAPLGKFNGLGTYTNRSHLAFAEIGEAWANTETMGEFWRELWVAAPIGDHLVEGYVDLLYRSPNGLVVVDWKTDQVQDDAAVAAKVARYRLQGAAYAAAVEAATGEAVDRMVFVFLNDDGPVEVELPDLAAAIAEVSASTAELAEASAVSEAVVEFE